MYTLESAYFFEMFSCCVFSVPEQVINSRDHVAARQAQRDLQRGG